MHWWHICIFPTAQSQTKKCKRATSKCSTTVPIDKNNFHSGQTLQRQAKKKGMHITAVWRNGWYGASYDSFVGIQTVVLRINICGVNPPLRQAANRYELLKLKNRSK